MIPSYKIRAKQTEINERWQSYLRSEKAQDDDYSKWLERNKKLDKEMRGFIKMAEHVGFRMSSNGWEIREEE